MHYVPGTVLALGISEQTKMSNLLELTFQQLHDSGGDTLQGVFSQTPNKKWSKSPSHLGLSLNLTSPFSWGGKPERTDLRATFPTFQRARRCWHFTLSSSFTRTFSTPIHLLLDSGLGRAEGISALCLFDRGTAGLGLKHDKGTYWRLTKNSYLYTRPDFYEWHSDK